MRAARLDRRIRAEAQALSRDAHAALYLKRNLRGKAGDLQTAVQEVDEAIAANDFQRVRRGLPALDSLVDELVKRPDKSTVRDYVESIGAAILIALALRAIVIEAFKIPSSSMYPTLEINDHIFVNKFIYGIRIPFTSTKLLEWRKPKRGEVIVFQLPCDPDRDYIKRVVATEGQSVEVRCNVLYVDGKPVENHLVKGEGCTYNDFEEFNGTWQVKPCSEYSERVDGHEYRTYHAAARPHNDQLRDKGLLPTGDDRDFPQLLGDHKPPNCSSQAENVPGGAANQLPGTVVETKTLAGACELQMHYVVPPHHVFAMGDNRSNSNDSRYWGSVPIENIRGKALFIWLSYDHWGLFDWTGLRFNRIGAFVQ